MSDSVQPHGLQPTRLRRPWDCPGKSTGVGCHCLLPDPNLNPYDIIVQSYHTIGTDSVDGSWDSGREGPEFCGHQRNLSLPRREGPAGLTQGDQVSVSWAMVQEAETLSSSPLWLAHTPGTLEGSRDSALAPELGDPLPHRLPPVSSCRMKVT